MGRAKRLRKLKRANKQAKQAKAAKMRRAVSMMNRFKSVFPELEVMLKKCAAQNIKPAIISQIHDEIVWEVPGADKEKLEDIMQDMIANDTEQAEGWPYRTGHWLEQSPHVVIMDECSEVALAVAKAFTLSDTATTNCGIVNDWAELESSVYTETLQKLAKDKLKMPVHIIKDFDLTPITTPPEFFKKKKKRFNFNDKQYF